MRGTGDGRCLCRTPPHATRQERVDDGRRRDHRVLSSGLTILARLFTLEHNRDDTFLTRDVAHLTPGVIRTRRLSDWRGHFQVEGVWTMKNAFVLTTLFLGMMLVILTRRGESRRLRSDGGLLRFMGRLLRSGARIAQLVSAGFRVWSEPRRQRRFPSRLQGAPFSQGE